MFKSKKDANKENEASVNHDEVDIDNDNDNDVIEAEAIVTEESLSEENITDTKKAKPSVFKTFLLFTTFFLASLTALGSYYVYLELEQLKQLQSQSPATMHDIQPMHQQVQQAISEQAEKINQLSEQQSNANVFKEQVSQQITEQQQSLSSIDEQLSLYQTALDELKKTAEVTETTPEKITNAAKIDQQSLEQEIKQQLQSFQGKIEQWSQNEISDVQNALSEKTQTNLANLQKTIEEKIQSLSSLLQTSSTELLSKSESQVKQLQQQTDKAFKQITSTLSELQQKTIQLEEKANEVVVTPTPTPKEKLNLPDLSVLKLYEAKSLSQSILDSLAYSSNTDKIASALEQLKKKLIPNEQFKELHQYLNEAQAKLSPISTDKPLKTLTSIIQNIDELEVRGSQLSTATKGNTENPPAQAETTGDELNSAKDKFINEIKSLLVFRHKDGKLDQLIAPEQVFLIKQKLLLKLEIARLALIEKNQSLYQSVLNESLDIVKQYFDTSSEQVASTQQKIITLLKHQFSLNSGETQKNIEKVTQLLSELIAKKVQNND